MCVWEWQMTNDNKINGKCMQSEHMQLFHFENVRRIQKASELVQRWYRLWLLYVHVVSFRFVNIQILIRIQMHRIIDFP